MKLTKILLSVLVLITVYSASVMACGEDKSGSDKDQPRTETDK